MDNTKDKIIQTAIKWIKTDNYENLSMRKLAAKIGLTTGAIYKYFQNKDELFYHVSIKLSQQLSTELLTNSEVSAKDELLLLASKLCQLSQEQSKLVNFLFFNPSLTNFYQKNNQDFELYNRVMNLAHQVNQGGITDQQFFTQIWAFIQGYSLLITNQTTRYDHELVARTLYEMIRGSQK